METEALELIGGWKLDPPDELLKYALGCAVALHSAREWHWVAMESAVWDDTPLQKLITTKYPECHSRRIGDEPAAPLDFGEAILSRFQKDGLVFYAGKRNDGVGFWSTKERPAELDQPGD